MTTNIKEILTMKIYLNEFCGGKINFPSTNDDWRALFRGFIPVLNEIADNYDLLQQELDSLKKDRSKKEMDNSFAKAVLSKIAILKNIINEKNKDKENEFISMGMLQVETIEKEVIDKNTVTKQQLERLNEIYKEYTS